MKRISDEWWVGLDETYKTRVDDGSLVFWRPERTVWINVWKDHEGRTGPERLRAWSDDRHASASDLFREEDGGLLRFGYLLEEPEDDGGPRLGVYSYTVAATSTVQLACYFDLRDDLPWAVAVARSLSFGGADPARAVDDHVGENGHLVLASDRIIGPDREPVLFAYREAGANDQDSGWRFFHGDEDEEFNADPDNIALCPLSSLLGLDPSLRALINSPAGSAWLRDHPGAPWHPARAPADERPDWE